jgi:hypothetical protein
MTTDTFDALAAATGAFLAEIAERARREQPAVHAAIDAALAGGESYTLLTVKLFEGGIQLRASINRISDGTEQAILDEVDGVVRPQ